MKKYIIQGLCCLLSIIGFSACSNDFLNEKIDPTSAGAVFPETLYLTGKEQGIQQFELSVPNVKNAHYKIMLYPQWMLFTAMEGHFINGTAVFNFEFNRSYQNYPEPGYEIPGHMTIDIQGLGVAQLNISYVNPGQPHLQLSPASFDFGTKENRFEETIQNSGNGPLNWMITEKPDWITVTGDKEGVLAQNNAAIITFVCNRNEIEPGKYTGTIVVESNAVENPKQTIRVDMEVLNYVNPESTISIEGTVTDSWYNKTKDLLYITTKAPNYLLVYDTKQDVMSKLPLDKAPNCIDVSQDGSLILIGQSGQLSCISGQSLSVTKRIDLDFNVFDVAYGENDWCYLTVQSDNNWVPWYYIDLNTDKVYEKNNSWDNICSNTYLQKIPGTPLLLASRKNMSPNGVIVTDISQGIPGEQKYWHQSYGPQFWFSEDGKYTYGGNSYVMKTPNMLTGNTLYELGILGSSQYLDWADHSSNTRTIWTTPEENFWRRNDQVKSYDDANYELTQSLSPSDYVTTIEGKKDFYPTHAHYIFANYNGDHVFLVKNVLSTSSDKHYNAWSLEKFKVK